MSNILKPDKWNLLHQEGVMLVEQAIRKLQDEDCPVDYAERTVSRIDNLIIEYTKELDVFHQQATNNRKKLSMVPLHVAIDRGPNNLNHSMRDVQLAYDRLVSLFTDEFNQKLHSLTTIREHYAKHVTQVAFAGGHVHHAQSDDAEPLSSSGSSSCASSSMASPPPTSADGTTSMQDDTENISNVILQYPWVQQSIQQMRQFPDSYTVENPEDPAMLALVMNQHYSSLHREDDLKALVEVFELRHGFDDDAAQKLVRIITESFTQMS